MLGKGKRGPALRNRLVGDAEMHKGLLNQEPLRAEDGVKYFRDTLRPTSSKRFYQFTHARRGNIEMVKWIGKFSLLLLPVSTMREERREKQCLVDVTQLNEERPRRHAAALDPNSKETSDHQHAIQVTNLERLFPFSDNLTTLMVIVASELSEAQRERLICSLSLQGMNVTVLHP